MSDTNESPDAIKRIPANENPWYLLATLHGEQPEWAYALNYDEDLYAKNLYSWNRFISKTYNSTQITNIKNIKSVEYYENMMNIGKFENEEEDIEFLKLYKKRGGRQIPNGRINFSNTKFDKTIIFENYIFSTIPNFNNSLFCNNINFKKSVFIKSTNFIDSIFVKNSYFEEAVFLEYVSFKGAKFSMHLNFDKATFFERSDFRNAEFCGISEFSNIKFGKATRFYGSIFCLHPPEFFGSTFHEDTDWQAINWPPPPAIEDAGSHIRAYERLKQEMERLKKHEEEHNFLCLEMACKEVRDGFPKNIPSKLYRWLSDYGRSVARPVVGLAATWFFGGWFYENITHLNAANSFGLSAASVADITGFIRKTFLEEDIKKLSGFAQGVSSAQTFFGLLFAFLIGLALRNRFRMK